jgi:hypothetical protein
MKTMLRYAAVFGMIVVAGVVLFFFNPATAVFYPKCLFHKATGLYCPGCGMTRALYCLLHGELRKGLHENALAILALPVLGGMMLQLFLRRRPPAAGSRFRPIWIAAILTVIAAFGVLRNVPCQPFSCLAPPGEAMSATK